MPIDHILELVDINGVVARVNLDQIMARVDVNAVVSTVDIPAIISRVDLGGIVNQVIDEVDLPEIIWESSGGMASATVVGVRMQGRTADERIDRIVDRVLRRRRIGTRRRPLIGASHDRPFRNGPGSGPRFPGPASRNRHPRRGGAVDFLIVIVAICLIYGGIAGVTFIIRPSSFHWPRNTGWTLPVLYFVLLTAYLAFSWAGTGRTYGAALLGVRVVNHKGATMRLPGAILRAVLCGVFPIGLLWVAD